MIFFIFVSALLIQLRYKCKCSVVAVTLNKWVDCKRLKRVTELNTHEDGLKLKKRKSTQTCCEDTFVYGNVRACFSDISYKFYILVSSVRFLLFFTTTSNVVFKKCHFYIVVTAILKDHRANSHVNYDLCQRFLLTCLFFSRGKTSRFVTHACLQIVFCGFLDKGILKAGWDLPLLFQKLDV